MSIFKKLNKTDSTKAEMPFIQHLEVLRWHIIRSLLAITIITIIVLFFVSDIYHNIILAPTNSEFITYKWLCKIGEKYNLKDMCFDGIAVKFQNLEVSGQFMFYIKSAILFGAILSIPYILFELIKFVKPALKPKEYTLAIQGIFGVTVLFFLGILFAFYILVPYTIQFFVNFKIDDSVENIFTIQSYFSTFSSVIIGCGVIFLMPLIMVLLSKIGVANPEIYIKYRKHMLLVILFIAAIITPPDILSQIIVSIPMLILYEMGILISKFVFKKTDHTMPVLYNDK